MARQGKPDSSGWWRWFEGGDGRGELLFLDELRGHCTVAYDDELEEELGREIHPDENYWEGTDCDDRCMPGLWEKVERAVALREKKGKSAPLPVALRPEASELSKADVAKLRAGAEKGRAGG